MLYKYTVFCEIIQLRGPGGLRLPPKDWPAPVRGDMRVERWSAARHNLSRALRIFSLWTDWGTSAFPNHHIIDPITIDMLGDGMLWRGYTSMVTPQGICEHEQLWIVRPRQSLSGPDLPKFDPSPYMRRLPDVYVQGEKQ